jgi:hypothetical protein
MCSPLTLQPDAAPEEGTERRSVVLSVTIRVLPNTPPLRPGSDSALGPAPEMGASRWDQHGKWTKEWSPVTPLEQLDDSTPPQAARMSVLQGLPLSV